MQQDTEISYQVLAFTTTVGLGVLTGFTYDFFRVLRKMFRPSRRVLFFCDLFFWLVMTAAVFTGLLASNWGEVRAYVLIGLSLGGAFYALLLSGPVYKAMYFLTDQLRRFFLLIMRPIMWLFFRISNAAAATARAVAKKVAKKPPVLKE